MFASQSNSFPESFFELPSILPSSLTIEKSKASLFSKLYSSSFYVLARHVEEVQLHSVAVVHFELLYLIVEALGLGEVRELGGREGVGAEGTMI